MYTRASLTDNLARKSARVGQVGGQVGEDPRACPARSKLNRDADFRARRTRRGCPCHCQCRFRSHGIPAVPRAWNTLPTDLKLLRSTESFRRQVKPHLFESVYGHQGKTDLVCDVLSVPSSGRCNTNDHVYRYCYTVTRANGVVRQCWLMCRGRNTVDCY